MTASCPGRVIDAVGRVVRVPGRGESGDPVVGRDTQREERELFGTVVLSDPPNRLRSRFKGEDLHAELGNEREIEADILADAQGVHHAAGTEQRRADVPPAIVGPEPRNLDFDLGPWKVPRNMPDSRRDRAEHPGMSHRPPFYRRSTIMPCRGTKRAHGLEESSR